MGKLRSKPLSASIQEEDLEHLRNYGAQISAPAIHSADSALEDIDIDKEKTQRPKLSLQQKSQVSLTVLFSFLACSFLFFPYTQLIDYFFNSISHKLSFSVTKADLNLFSPSTLENLSYQLTPSAGLRVGSMLLEAPLISFIGNAVDMRAKATNFLFTSESIKLRGKTIWLDIQIQDRSSDIRAWQASFALNGNNIELAGLSLAALESMGINLTNLSIQELRIGLVLEAGRLMFDSSRIVTNYFRGEIKGKAQLAAKLEATKLDAKLCLEAAPDLEEKNSALMGIFILAGEKPCLEIKGSLQTPKFEMPSRAISPSNPIESQENFPTGAAGSGEPDIPPPMPKGDQYLP